MSPTEVRDTAMAKLDDVAENVYTKILARFSMIAASVVILPLALWMANRTLTRIDDMQNSINILSLQQNTLTNSTNGLSAALIERTSDRYTGQQAAKDWNIQASRDSQQDADRARIEHRVDTLETRVFRQH